MGKRILVIAGASGVVGKHIIDRALHANWEVRTLSRYSKNILGVKNFQWNPNSTTPQITIVEALENADFLINLTGSNIAKGQLGKKARNEVLHSRISSTATLIKAYSKCTHPPSVWGQASAIGYYGSTGGEIITEQNASGNLFLSDVCIRWENEAKRILTINPQIKLLIARFGMVLAKDAPAWQKIVKPVSMGVGGALGSGDQWYSWIDADDLANAFFHLYKTKNPGGIFNFTSPEAIRQVDMAKAIAKFYHKPCFAKIPAPALRLFFGRTADELLLSSCRALPQKLTESGFQFEFSTLQSEISHLLTRW